MKLSFHGADQDVTGSCHLLDTGAMKILIASPLIAVFGVSSPMNDLAAEKNDQEPSLRTSDRTGKDYALSMRERPKWPISN